MGVDRAATSGQSDTFNRPRVTLVFDYCHNCGIRRYIAQNFKKEDKSFGWPGSIDNH